MTGITGRAVSASALGALAFISMGQLPRGAGAQSFEFTAEQSQAWGNEDNWMPSGIPGRDPYLDASVTIPSKAGPAVLEPAAGETFVSALDAEGGLVLQDRLNVSQSGTIRGLTMSRSPSGGGVTGIEAFAGVTVEIRDGMGGASVWSFGSLANNGAADVLGTLELTGQQNKQIIDSFTLRNLGTLHWKNPAGGEGPVLGLSGEASVVNQGGTLRFDEGTDIFTGSHDTRLRNASGSIEVYAGELDDFEEVIWDCFYEQSGGSLEVRSGLLSLLGDADLAGGSVTVLGGATLDLGGSTTSGVPTRFSGLSAITGSGTLGLRNSTGGAFIVDQPVTINVADARLEENLDVPDAGTAVTNEGTLEFHGVRLSGNGSLVNRDEMTVEAVGLSARVDGNATLRNEASLEISESSTLRPQGAATVENTPGGTITLGPDADLDGTATEAASIVNRGVIEKIGLDADGSPTGSAVEIEDGVYIHDDGAELRVDDGVVDLVSRAGVWGDGGGSFTANLGGGLFIGAGTVTVTGEHTLGGVGPILRGTTTYDEHTIQLLGGTLIFDVDTPDAFTHDADAIQGSGDLFNDGYFAWSSGELRGSGLTFVNNRFLSIGSLDIIGATLINNLGARQVGDITINGGGRIRNNGDWPNDNDDITGDGTFINTGTFIAEFGSPVVSVAFDNRGVVEVENAAAFGGLTFTDAVQFQGGTLAGGTWIVSQDGRLTFTETDTTPLTTIGPGASVTGDDSNFPMTEITTIDGGSLEATGDVGLDGVITTENGGSLRIGPDAGVSAPGGAQNGEPDPPGGIMSEMDQSPVILRPRSRERGPATTPMLTTPALENFGRLLPGGDGAPGPFNVTGDVLFRDAGELRIEIAGAEPITTHDQVRVNGAVSLGGELRVALLSGFTPDHGDQFTIIRTTAFDDERTGEGPGAGSESGMGVSGSFDRVTGDGGWEVSVNPTTVVLTFVSPCNDADLAEPFGLLDLSDINAFVTAFSTDDLLADLDGNGLLDLTDIGLFVSAFTGGCP